jgi:geranylgeranyl pyrophosphate synthase
MLYRLSQKQYTMSTESQAIKSLKILGEKSEKALINVKQQILEQKIADPKTNKAISQYVSRWNDTTRPGILALACEAAGGELDEATPLQVALLFIDATMDIHDDIIDDSVAKKNVKTLYGRLGKEAALLIGDGFMVKGFSHLHQAIESLPRERQDMIMATVNDFLLEVMDAHIQEIPLKAKKWHVKPETYLQVITKKSADLEGHMKIGAIYGGGSPKEVQALGTYGRTLGLLLAIRLEFIDIFETDELSNRIKYECLPLPILYAIQNKTQRAKIKQILSNEKISQSNCDEIVDIVQASKEVSDLRNHLETLKKEAVNSLASLKNRQAKSNLTMLAASMLEDL